MSVHDEAGLHFMADVRQRLLEPIAEAEAEAVAAVPSAKEGGAKDYFASAAEGAAAHPHRATPPPNGRDASDYGGFLQHPVEVIPARVVTYAAVVRCESLHELSWVGDAAGFDVSALNSFRHDKVRLRRMSKDWGFMLSEVAAGEMWRSPYEIMTVNFMTDSPDDDVANNASEDGLLAAAAAAAAAAVVVVEEAAAWARRWICPCFQAWRGNPRGGGVFEAILDPHGDVTLSTSPWAADNSFARQQHWGQLVELLPLSYDDDDDDSSSSDGQVRSGGGGGRVSGKPQSVEEGDVLRLTTNEVHGANAARSFSFPDVTVIRGCGGS